MSIFVLFGAKIFSVRFKISNPKYFINIWMGFNLKERKQVWLLQEPRIQKWFQQFLVDFCEQ